MGDFNNVLLLLDASFEASIRIWKILTFFITFRCTLCGSRAIHILCGKLDKQNPEFICQDHKDVPEEGPVQEEQAETIIEDLG